MVSAGQDGDPIGCTTGSSDFGAFVLERVTEGGKVKGVGVVEDARYDGVDCRPWGKCDRATLRVYSLLFHLIDVGAVAGVLWTRFLTQSQRMVVSVSLNMRQEQALSLVCFLAAMHDIGKLIPNLQSCEPAAYVRLREELLADTGPVVNAPHARASMHVGLHLLRELGFSAGGNDSPAVRAAQCLGGHHGRFLQLDVDGAASAQRVDATLGARLAGPAPPLCPVAVAPVRRRRGAGSAVGGGRGADYRADDGG
ncbi:HD domain-containing protein [Streptomyces sp. DSM 116494]|uniref:HD domain-containing protein n=1 Tax=Streptomyces okerensis TaxID=3344655 RepID=UPI00388FBC28